MVWDEFARSPQGRIQSSGWGRVWVLMVLDGFRMYSKIDFLLGDTGAGGANESKWRRLHRARGVGCVGMGQQQQQQQQRRHLRGSNRGRAKALPAAATLQKCEINSAVTHTMSSALEIISAN